MKQNRIVIGTELVVFMSFYLWNTYDNISGAEEFVFIYPFNLGDGSLIARLILGLLFNSALFFGFIYVIFPWWKLKGYGSSFLGAGLLSILLGVTAFEWGLYEGLTLLYDLPEQLSHIYGMDYENLPMRREIDYPILGVNAGMLSGALLYTLSREQIRQYLEAPKRKAVQLQQELNYLRAQINPHFLFNALNNIYSINLKNEDHESAEAIQKLSGMMRYMLYESGTDWVKLEQEVHYISNYIGIQQLRYTENEIDIDWKVEEGIESLLVPPLLFIPFIENAFKYGVKIGQLSQISIQFFRANKKLNFSCKNTIQVKSSQVNHGGIGLENVRKRLELLFPNSYTFEVMQVKNEYEVHLGIDLKMLRQNV